MFSQYNIHTMYNNTGTLNPCSNQEQWIQKQNKGTLHKCKYIIFIIIIIIMLSINKSFELCYFGTKDSVFCRPFPSHSMPVSTCW